MNADQLDKARREQILQQEAIKNSFDNPPDGAVMVRGEDESDFERARR